MYLTIEDIDNYDLSFINDEQSINYIKYMLKAIYNYQKKIEENYNNFWEDARLNRNFNYDFINNMELNIWDYIKSGQCININDYHFSQVLEYLENYYDHSGFSITWTFINTRSLLILGIDEYRRNWITN